MADEEVTIEKVKSEQERLDANKRKAEEDGAVIELSGDEADAAAVTPAPKKKKKAKRELLPAPCVCGVIAKGNDRRDTNRCLASGAHNCVCVPIEGKRPVACRGDPDNCPCICKKGRGCQTFELPLPGTGGTGAPPSCTGRATAQALKA